MLALTLVAALTLARNDGPSCVDHSDEGPFATCFDPGRGLELFGGGGAINAAAAGSVGTAVRLRGDRDSHSKAGSTWLSMHRLLDSELTFGQQHSFDGTLYESVWRRHVPEGFVLLPFNPPVKVPFPVDLGLYGRLGHYQRRWSEGDGWALETARVAMLFDPLRSASGRFHLGFGPALSHTMRWSAGAMTHELTPLTELQLVVNLESDDGLWVLRATGFAGVTFTPGENTAAFRAHGEVALERVVVALNDHPVSVGLHGSGAFRDAGSHAGNEWRVGAGLKVQLWARRD